MKNFVQTKNPKTGLYVKINKTDGVIVAHKKTPGPFKGIPFARQKKESTPKELTRQVNNLMKEIKELETKIKLLVTACQTKD